jgi:hypothetical protein
MMKNSLAENPRLMLAVEVEIYNRWKSESMM